MSQKCNFPRKIGAYFVTLYTFSLKKGEIPHMDFYRIEARQQKGQVLELHPAFTFRRSKDLMVRANSFYAIWDEKANLWSTDEFDVIRLIDEDLALALDDKKKTFDGTVVVKWMHASDSNSWYQFQRYLLQHPETAIQLDTKLTFANTQVSKSDYVSKRLPYSMEKGSYEAWDIFMSTAYDPDDRKKIEWAIGSIVAGEAKNIQKFLVIYGEAGSGKSTTLNIIQKLFDGYYTTFEAKALGSFNNSFATESFRGNPLVAIEHDGDLSRIEDNTKLNSLVSHEEMTMNQKFKSTYTAKSNAFVIMGTNKAVKITDAKSGLLRRLIDVRTSGRKIPSNQYSSIYSRMGFELGAIAYHCLEVFNELGKDYYDHYKPIRMQSDTDFFYSFMDENYYIFKQQDGTTLTQAWEMYKTYCDDSSLEYRLPRNKFRAELSNYFKSFKDVGRNSEGNQVRSVFSGFKLELFDGDQRTEAVTNNTLILDKTESIFDAVCSDYVAQLASPVDFFPIKKWALVNTKLSDLDTSQLHYVVLPPNHIYIDFDLKDADGQKSQKLNLEAASKFPPTYAEYSKSGAGIHLHYYYDGEVDRLANVYSDGIEIKRTTYGEKGPSTLRRKLSKCNDLPIATISGGLPLKGEKVINPQTVQSERGLRDLILRNLKKEIHPGTKPSIDFIFKILDEAYNSGMKYDLTTLRPKVLAFANNSTNQSEACVKLVSKMKFKSDHSEEELVEMVPDNDDTNIVFYDVEVFPNLFIVCWKRRGDNNQKVRMINPTPNELEPLLKMKLVGFNCRRYDNHILYARYIGYDNLELFNLSSKIVKGSSNSFFREAYSISYTDIYDFASAGNKKSLKKWEIELGIHHQELGFPWDQPVPEEKWLEVASYCDNDVDASEKVFDHLSGDWEARKVLARLSGLSVNDTTNQHTIKIIFGSDKDTQDSLVYTKLETIFPGYTFDAGKSLYRGEDPKEGGYVYAEPGMYENVALLDVASMHPTSIVELNLLGKYTKKYAELKEARVHIKHKNLEPLKTLLDGKLKPLLQEAESGKFTLKDLANGLKTALNSAYGLTYASFDNPFRDPRNVDNIVAKRGALFMIDLKYALQEKGYKVVHIKTDSVKIANATPEIISFVFEFGKRYGYDFEHESTYSKFCLVNDAVYIAKEEDGSWTATGAEFQHPFVFKTLFSKEEITFVDMCETKAVTGDSALYLDMNEGIAPEGEHSYQFVGRIGLFCPVKEGAGGGVLVREKEGKYYAATGTKGYRWLEAETLKTLGLFDQIDTTYHNKLVSDAIDHISHFGDFDYFVSDK